MKCILCQNKFTPRRADHRYCSYRCRDAARYYRNREKRLEKDRIRYENMSDEQKRERFLLAVLRNKKKWKVRQTVRNAISREKIRRLPCEECGEKETHAHHNNYSKPLQVEWLCKKHHYEKHRKYIIFKLKQKQ